MEQKIKSISEGNYTIELCSRITHFEIHGMKRNKEEFFIRTTFNNQTSVESGAFTTLDSAFDAFDNISNKKQRSMN